MTQWTASRNRVPRREYLVKEMEATGDMLVDLGSDQTSCHNPFNGGYYPCQIGFNEANKMMVDNPTKFKGLVEER